MKKNKIRFWQLAGLALVLIVARVCAKRKPKPAPRTVMTPWEYAQCRRAGRETEAGGRKNL